MCKSIGVKIFKVKSVLFSALILLSFLCDANDIRFDHITSVDGISQSEVYAFLRDSYGFMWIGTVDGLNRFDGNDIQIYNTDRNNPHSLSNNTIRSLAEDQQGRIWIGTDDGLNFYDPRTELICQVEVNSNEEIFTVRSLFIQQNQLFIGTNDGLWKTSIKENSVKVIEEGFQKIDHITNNPDYGSQICKIMRSKQGGIWIIAFDYISRIIFEPNQKKPIIIEEITFDGFNSIVSATEDSTGCLWIASDMYGLIRYNPVMKESQRLTEENEFGQYSKQCSALAYDKEGRLWVGTLDKGLLRLKYDFNKKRIDYIESIQQDPDNLSSLNSNLIYSLYLSKDNKLWVGTIGAGVNIFNPEQKKFRHILIKETDADFPNSNFIRALYVDNNNRIFAGVHNNGLYLLDRNNSSTKKLGFGSHSIFHINRYKENLYFICAGNGIFLVRYNGNNLEILDQNDQLGNFAAFFVVKGDGDIYWFATLKGLFRMRVVNNRLISDKLYNEISKPNISTNNCRVLYYDDINNQLLVGTEGGGVNYLILNDEGYPEEIKVYEKGKDAKSLSNNYVRSIIRDQNKNIWIGTYEGLNKVIETNYGEKAFKSYTKKDGLPNNMIESIIEDNNNCLWIATNGGLSKFSPSDSNFVNYNAIDGLQSNEFSEHTVFKCADGEIFLGGINGINTFYPKEIKISDCKPNIAITDFYLDNQRISVGEKVGKSIPLSESIISTDSIELLPKFKNIGFKFTAMIYPNAGKVQYAYMLDGFDTDWNVTKARNRNVNYTNLKHGNYIFKIKATNADGVWDDTPKEIYIHIQTPFAYTWFAYALYAAGIMLIFIYFSHFTIIRYTTKNKLFLENEHNEKLHQLDEMRTKFFINISHDLRTPLTLISGPLDNILEDKKIQKELRDKLLLIKRNVKRLNYLVEQLLDVRKAESGKLVANIQGLDIVSFTEDELSHFTYAIGKKGLKLIFLNKNEEITACFDPSMLSKVYFNLISNSIKYTTKGEITIKIARVPSNDMEILEDSGYSSYIMVEFNDTGSGIAEDKKQHVFERFYQDQKYSGKGYGIGLSHTQDLIKAHNGFVEVESIENIGTTIRLFLPVLENEDLDIKNVDASTEDIYINENHREETVKEEIDENMKTVLIVEDNVDMLNYIRDGLKDAYNVIIAADGVDGLQAAVSKVPDLIISDIMMPNMDGIELCEKIKTNIKTSHIPVILLTAKVDTQTRYEGIETGADDFIPKPFEMEYLQIRVTNLLKSRDQLRKLFQNSVVFEPSAVTINSLDEKFLTSLMGAIEENMSDSEFSVNSLESSLGMSHSSFYRKIKNLTGQSGQEIVQNMRMKRALQILSEKKGYNVSEVAYMVGFTNPKYFSKCFKEMYGYAPAKLKK